MGPSLDTERERETGPSLDTEGSMWASWPPHLQNSIIKALITGRKGHLGVHPYSYVDTCRASFMCMRELFVKPRTWCPTEMKSERPRDGREQGRG
jgi:hypothetical protein